MRIEDARIREHREVAAGYRLLVMAAPTIAPLVKPGQFVHLRIPHYETVVLRRPFSVYWTQGDSLAVLYKAVGRGTRALADVEANEFISVMGPLGHGFPKPSNQQLPVLVAGGYGGAALYMVAREAPVKGLVFMGAKSRLDILCPEVFADLRWEVRIATEDGSQGFRGLVTEAVEQWLTEAGGRVAPEFFACGPHAMLKKVGDIARAQGCTAWLSLDRHMGCGVGACLTCVQKIRTPGGGWHWERCCKEGPVFEASQIIWDDEMVG